MTQPLLPRRGVLAPFALVLVLGIGTLAAAEVTVSIREPLLLRVGERDLSVRIEPERIVGERIELRRLEQGLAGTVDEQRVELRWTDEGVITGQVGDHSLRLVSRMRIPEPGLLVEGWFGGDPAELVLAPLGISGGVGGCDYSLSMAGNRYTGFRTCDATRGPPVPVMLRLPVDLVSLGMEEESVLLALLLSAEAIPPPAVPSGESTP